jgi:hypothetical protein
LNAEKGCTPEVFRTTFTFGSVPRHADEERRPRRSIDLRDPQAIRADIEAGCVSVTLREPCQPLA